MIFQDDGPGHPHGLPRVQRQVQVLGKMHQMTKRAEPEICFSRTKVKSREKYFTLAFKERLKFDKYSLFAAFNSIKITRRVFGRKTSLPYTPPQKIVLTPKIIFSDD